MGTREELEADIAEVEQILRTAIRTNVKAILSTNIETLRKQIAAIPVAVAEPVEEEKVAPATRTYTSIKNFSWD